MSENIYFSITLIIYTRRSLRSLEQKEIKVKAIPNNNNPNEIVDLIVDLQNYNLTEESNYEIKSLNIEQNGENNIYYINSPQNSDNLNTGKINELLEKSEIDFSQKVNQNYKINIYKIQSISQGCDFDLISKTKINNDNNNLILNFEEKNEKSNIIKSNSFYLQIIIIK